MEMWISRSDNGDLSLHSTEPEKLEEAGCYTSFFNNGMDYSIDYKLFPEVTFKNSPQQVELKLRK